MRELPVGWSWATVADVGDVMLGRQRSPQYHTGPNMRHYLRVKNVFEDRIDLADVKEMDFSPGEYERYKLEPGDILLNEGQSPELIGRSAMYRGELPGSCFTNSLIRFRPRPGVDGRYALYLFRHYLRSGRFRQEARITTNIAHLSAQRFNSIEFPVPPLNEQLRIAAAIEEQFSRLDAANESVRRARAGLERFKARVLAASLDGSRERPLGEISTIHVGTTPSRRAPGLWGGGIPWVSSGEVAFCRIRQTRETISPAAMTSPDRLHPAGTVLLAMIGEGKTRGQAAVLDVAAAHNQNSAAIRLDPSLCTPEWLFYVLMARYETTRRAGSGAQQPALNRARVAALTVPLPPLDEQRRKVAQLDDQLSMLDATDNSIEAAKRRSAPTCRRSRAASCASRHSASPNRPPGRTRRSCARAPSATATIT